MKKNKRFREGLRMGLQEEDIQIIEAIENYNEIDFKELSFFLLRDDESVINDVLKEVARDEA